MNRFERVNKMLAHMDAVKLLEALIDYMDEDEVHDILDFIVIMYDIEEDIEEEE